MARRSVVRWIFLTVLTLCLAASVVTMFVVRGAFDDIWFFASLALYGMALLVYWLIVAGSRPAQVGDRDDVAEKVARALASGSSPASPTLTFPDVEPELVVEPSRTEPIVLPGTAAPTPAGYGFRGYTLYARGDSRFFSQAAPPGAQAIELPAGYEAKWDAKKQKPVLVELLEPEPEVAEPAVEVQQKPCSAMVAPGEFCERFAQEGSRFCSKHVDFTTDEEEFEVRKSSGETKGKGLRFGQPQIEIRTGKPSAAKPLKFKPTAQSDFEVRVAKPSNTKELEYKRGKPVEIKLDRNATKPFKPRSQGEVVVRVAKPSNLKPVRVGRAEEPVVRLAKPAAGKPVRFGKAAEPDVRVGKPPEPKPLRLRSAAEPVVRVDHAVAERPKRKGLPPSEVVVRAPPAPKAPAKGKQLGPSDILVKRAGGGEAPKKGKQLPASEIVVKKPSADKAPPKGKQLGASEVVVKQPGVAKPIPALKVGKEEFVVRNARDTRPAAKAPKVAQPEIVVVKDTKRRTMFGVEGEAPKKK